MNDRQERIAELKVLLEIEERGGLPDVLLEDIGLASYETMKFFEENGWVKHAGRLTYGNPEANDVGTNYVTLVEPKGPTWRRIIQFAIRYQPVEVFAVVDWIPPGITQQYKKEGYTPRVLNNVKRLKVEKETIEITGDSEVNLSKMSQVIRLPQNGGIVIEENPEKLSTANT